MMEMGQVVEVAAASASAPGPDGRHQIPVKVQEGIHQTLLDSRSSQTAIHQSLVRPEALVDASWVKMGCIHGDLNDYTLFGTNWLGFITAAKRFGDAQSRPTGRCGRCAVFAGDARSLDTVPGVVDLVEPPLGILPSPVFPPVGDFPLEQTCDNTLRFALSQVIKIDGQFVHPDAVITFPHFTIIKERLYRVSRDNHSGEEVSQLLVPKSRR